MAVLDSIFILSCLHLVSFMVAGGCMSQLSVSLSDNATKYNTYTNSCSTPPDIRSPEVYHAITVAMNKSSFVSAWLPIKKVYLGGWQWLNGEKYTSKAGQEQLGLDCAVLRSRVNVIDGVPCATVYPYYICGMRESRQENLPRNASKEVQILVVQDKVFLIKKQIVNWYEAKEHCHEAGYELATIPDTILKQLAKEIRSHFHKADNIWIGLRQRDYFFQLGLEDKKIFRQKWNSRSLCTCPEKECAVIRREGNAFLWEPELCDENHRFPCELSPHITNCSISEGATPPVKEDDKEKSLVTLSDNATTYEIYRQSCSAPPDIRQPSVFQSMTRAVQKGGASSVWLPIIRMYLGEWRWLNGSPYEKNMTNEKVLPGLDCAVLRLVNSKIDEVPCGNLYHYYICEMQSLPEGNYSLNNKTFKVLNLSLMTYIVKKDEVTWYQAKENCHTEGAKLASLPGLLLANISQKLKPSFKISDNFWIGLRQKDYYLQLDHPEEVIKQNWDQLCTCPEKNCAILNMTKQGAFVWEPEDCNATHRFACFSPAIVTNEPLTRKWWFTFIIVVGSLSLLTILVLVIRKYVQARRLSSY